MTGLPPPPVPADADNILISGMCAGIIASGASNSSWQTRPRVGRFFFARASVREPVPRSAQAERWRESGYRKARACPTQVLAPAIVCGLAAVHEAPRNALLEAAMPKRTQVTNPSPAVPDQLRVALAGLHSLIELLAHIADTRSLGDREVAVVNCLERRWQAVEQAMKGRR